MKSLGSVEKSDPFLSLASRLACVGQVVKPACLVDEFLSRHQCVESILAETRCLVRALCSSGVEEKSFVGVGIGELRPEMESNHCV